MRYTVKIIYTVIKEFEVEAESKEEAEHKVLIEDPSIEEVDYWESEINIYNDEDEE